MDVCQTMFVQTIEICSKNNNRTVVIFVETMTPKSPFENNGPLKWVLIKFAE